MQVRRSRLLALMFTDMVGSTGLKDELKTARYLPLLRCHDELLRQCIASGGGQVQQDTGDGCFAVFVTPSDAVRAALMFLWKLDSEQWPEGRRLSARVGIHLGEVIETEVRQDGGQKLVGLAVDLASRVMSLAEGGQILMTRGAFDDARQFVVSHPGAESVSLRWLAHGPYLLKGSSEPQDVFEVGTEGRSPLAPPPDSDKARRAVPAGDEQTLGWRPAIDLPLPGQPQWIIDRKIGEGCFGEVWRARHSKLKSLRVFKFCFDAEHLRALKREVVLFRVLKESLGNRRDISQVIDWRFDEAPYYIEMDYAPAGNLAAWAAAQGGIDHTPLESRLKIVSQIATALAAAHSVGILHKNIKPSNVMMIQEGAVTYPRLTDFGILTDETCLKDLNISSAGFTESNITPGLLERAGARMYAPPESMANKPHTVQGDIYSLGVLLYQMIVGDLEHPLGIGWERNVNDELLRQDIAACVDVDPARRLTSATELADRLDQIEIRRQALKPVKKAEPAAPPAQRSQTQARPMGAAQASGAAGDQILVRVICGEQREDLKLTVAAGQLIKVGRSPQADVVVRSTQVSRLHCELGIDSGRIFVRDTKSFSGTYVAGEKITEQRVLRAGEHISIGPAVIYVACEVAQPPVSRAPAAQPPVAQPLEQILSAIEATASPAAPTSKNRDIQQTITEPANQLPVAEPAQAVIQLTGDLLTIGRDPTCNVVLEDLMLSRRHAELRRKTDGWFVEDLGSTNGTFVNGQRLKKAVLLKVDDVLKIGAYQFHFKGTHLVSRSLKNDGIQIRVRGLVKQVRTAGSREPLRLLDSVSFDIDPGEFIGLLGPSGCGKSTLMDALNGRRPGTEGDVLYNDDDLYEAFESYSTGIGYVPQELIFHDSLPVADALRYTSRLRLSKDVSKADLEANIDRVLKTVGLQERRDTPIRSLSGGQKKRVSVAMELISRPSVLFLDEVTSGLDMATEREMMQLFRELANSGVTVICITHYLESLVQCNRLACLMRGRLVFHGPPAQLKEHFQIGGFTEVYDLAKRKSPEEWEQAFKQSRFYSAPTPKKPSAADAGKKSIGKGIDVDRFRRQVPVLTKRYQQLLVTDRTMPLILIGMAPLIALLLCLLTRGLTYTHLWSDAATAADAAKFVQKQNVLCFGAVLTILFLSLFGAVQEVVKELRVYHHERSVNLMIVPYMISKLLPLGVIGAMQASMILFVLNVIGGLHAGNVIQQLAILIAASFAGTTLGLAISAWVPEGSADSAAASEAAAATKAVTLMNAVVIPQVLFAGAIVTLTGASKLLARAFITAYWAYYAFVALIGPPMPDKFKAFRGESPGFTLCLLVLLAHSLVFTGLFFVGMVRKDGPGAFRRLVRTLPRDDRGRVAHDRVLVQLKELLRGT